MLKFQTIEQFAPMVKEPGTGQAHHGGNIAVVKLDDWSPESLAASKIYARKDFFKISLITGDATYHYRDSAYKIESGECALIFTNQETPYRWEVHSGGCNGYACMFTADFMPLHTHIRPDRWSVFDADKQSFFQLAAPERDVFETLFQTMISEQHSGYAGKYELLFLYVLECIHQAMKLNPENNLRKQNAATHLTQSFKALLTGQFPLVTPLQQITLRSPKEYADNLAVHTNYLNRAIREVTGKTTTQLITERIMQEAQALLLHSEWTISQISTSLGFDQPTHFTKAFRKYTGFSPTEIRQKV